MTSRTMTQSGKRSRSGPRSSSLAMAPGASGATNYTVPIILDTEAESNEVFFVILSHPTNCTIADGTM